MALQITTTLELDGGVTVSSAYAVLTVNLEQTFGDVYKLNTQMRLYKDKASFDASEAELTIKPSTIPTGVRFISGYAITQGNYSNLDMGVIHTQLINILEDGNADGNYPSGADASWTGLGNATVTTVDLI
jgi:hypothetical protein